MTELTDTEQAMLDALLATRKQMDTLIPFFKGCIYGDSGFGKTIFALKLAKAVTPPGKTIEYVDFLEGWVAALNHRDEGLLENVHREQYQGISQIETIAKFVKMNVEPFASIGTVVLDEFSSMTKTDLDVVLKSRAAKDSSKDPNVPMLPDFYAGTERARRALTTLLQANINVIVVAHIREDQLSNGAVVTRPAFMPNFNETFRQMMHLVGHLTAEEFTSEEGAVDYKRSVQVHPTKRVNAKTRIGGLNPNVEPDALITAVVEWMKGKRESEPLDDLGEDELGNPLTGDNPEVPESNVSPAVETDSADDAISVD